MKTLIVKYLPGKEISKTKQLYDQIQKHFINKIVTEIDLEITQPSFFNNESLMAYYQRNYQGKTLNSDQEKLMKVMDDFTEKVKNADIVILISPMHNFGMPGIVKTWFDNIIQKGIAFEYGAKGPYGMFKGKKALTVFTSGGSYSSEKVTANYPEWDSYTFLSKIEFSFMGFDEVEVISASTANSEMADKNLHEAKLKIDQLLSKWLL